MYIKNCNLKKMLDEMQLLQLDSGDGCTIPTREKRTSIEGRGNQENLDDKKKTLDDLLMDKRYQSEFDKKVAKALKTAKVKWENENAHPTIKNNQSMRIDSKPKLEHIKQKRIEEFGKEKREIATREIEAMLNEILLEKLLSRVLVEKLNYSNIKSDNKSIDLIVDTLQSAVDGVVIKLRDRKESKDRQAYKSREIKNSLIIITDIDLPTR